MPAAWHRAEAPTPITLTCCMHPVTQATSDSVVIEISGQTVTLDIKDVRAIHFTAATPASNARQTAPTEALRALKAVNSATTVGVSYQVAAPPGADRPVDEVGRPLGRQHTQCDVLAQERRAALAAARRRPRASVRLVASDRRVGGRTCKTLERVTTYFD